jgi:hypothetical protein
MPATPSSRSDGWPAARPCAHWSDMLTEAMPSPSVPTSRCWPPARPTTQSVSGRWPRSDDAETEWAAVHADWQALARTAEAVGRFAEEDDWEEFAAFWRRMVAVAGPWLTLVNLSMRRHGPGRVWDQIRERFGEFTQRLECNPEWQEQVRSNWQAFGMSRGPVDGGDVE